MTNHERLWVTIDARALDGALMGTQILVLELTRALAHTRALRLRVLTYAERIDPETLRAAARAARHRDPRRRGD